MELYSLVFVNCFSDVLIRQRKLGHGCFQLLVKRKF